MANDKRLISPSDMWLTDAVSGAIVGVLNKVGSAAPESLFGTGSGGGVVVTPAVSVSASRNLTSADEGLTLDCSTALTLTLTAGLALKSVTIIPPDTGNVSIASAGGVLLNGAVSTIARGATLNAVVAIVGRATTDAYKVTGA